MAYFDRQVHDEGWSAKWLKRYNNNNRNGDNSLHINNGNLFQKFRHKIIAISY